MLRTILVPGVEEAGETVVDAVKDYIDQHLSTVSAMREQAEQIELGIDLCAGALQRGNKLLLCGNGGSAGDAQHIAAELVGRLVHDRKALPAIALTTDTSALTAIANDYGYEAVFSRQIEALASEGDVLVAISTSGNSVNVNLACRRAAELGCATLALSGKGGGELLELADLALVVPADETAHIQECHIVLGHLLCAGIESRLGLA